MKIRTNTAEVSGDLFTPCANGREAERLVQIDEAGTMLPIRVTAEAETTKAGMRRMMLKVSANLPKDLIVLNTGSPIQGQLVKNEWPFSVHFVAAVPSASVRNANAIGAKIIVILQKYLLALLSNGSSTSTDHLASWEVGDPLTDGIVGKNPLDLVSGDYGVAYYSGE